MLPERSTCPACGSGNHVPSWVGSGRFLDYRFQYRDCTLCRSVFVDPLPNDALVTEMYSPEYIYHHYDDGDASAEIGAELDRTAADAARLRPGGRLLDIGCGAGRFLQAARDAGLRPEGHELLASTAKLAADATGLLVHSGSLCSLRGPYDMVHFADVLEHVPDPLGLLVDARRLLTPDGVVIARGPLEQQPSLFQQAVRWQRTVKSRVLGARSVEMAPWHISQFTLRGWTALLERAGLRVVEQRLYETRWPAPDSFNLRPLTLVKVVSRIASASDVGRRLQLGNRVVSWLAAA